MINTSLRLLLCINISPLIFFKNSAESSRATLRTFALRTVCFLAFHLFTILHASIVGRFSDLGDPRFFIFQVFYNLDCCTPAVRRYCALVEWLPLILFPVIWSYPSVGQPVAGPKKFMVILDPFASFHER